MKPLVLILAALVGGSVPAAAYAQSAAAATADEPFACLFEGVADERRAWAGAAAFTRLTGSPAEGEQRGAPVLGEIMAALPRCAAAGRWTELQRNVAEQYPYAQLAREHMRRRYAAQTVDLGFLDELAGRAMQPDPPDYGVPNLVARIRAQGVGDDRPDSAEDIFFIYWSLALEAERARVTFACPGLASGNPRC